MPTTTNRKTLLGRSMSPSPRVQEMIAEPAAEPCEQVFERGVRAVLFSDIVGSTSFFEQHGDEAGMAMVERHNRLLFPQVEAHNGRVVKTIGDAIMASYPSAEDAVRSAIAMQTALKEHNAGAPAEDRISVRIGINFGEVILKEQDVFGDVVNAAARVESLAAGGMILVSDSVARAKNQIACLPYDAVLVKGKREPIEVFEIDWDPNAPAGERGPRPLVQAGDIVGARFEIVSLLGEGGMGQVYRALDRELDEEVALKFIRADLATDPESLARFRQEVKLARSVTHKNICRIHELLRMDRHTFISMELIEGHDLDDVIRREAPLDAEAATRIIGGICAGLSAAHERGITHRDLKPGNVMIENETGRVVITDFGIARLVSARRGQTEAGLVVGTPEYMSPEQAQGLEVGPAADIYSLGVIVYELLTGKLPHTASTPVAVALKQVTEEPAPPREVNPSIPANLEAAVLRCLRKDPGRRFESARALAEALGVEPALVATGRRRLAIALSAVALLALALAGVFLADFFTEKGPGGNHVLRRLVSSQALEQAARWSPDGRSFAFLRNGDVWTDPYPPAAGPRRVTRKAGATDEFDMAGLAWGRRGDFLLFPKTLEDKSILRRTSVSGDSERTVIEGAGAADISPDGLRLAFTAQNDHGGMDIFVSDQDGADKKVVAAGDESVSYLRPRWNPGGDSLAVVAHYLGYASSRDIGVVEVGNDKLRLLTNDGRKNLAYNTDPTWSPDGDWIVYASKRGGIMSLWCVPAGGGESLPLTQGATRDQRGPDVSPDGATILFNTAERRLDISALELAGGRETHVSDDVWVDRFPVFSPNGKRIAYRSQRDGAGPKGRSIVLYEPAERAEEIITAPEGMRDFTWCGGGRLVYTQTVESDRSLGRVDLDLPGFHVLVRGFHRLWAPSADDTCRTLVFVGQKSATDSRRLWVVPAAGGAPRLLHEEAGSESYPAVSPDGKWIAYRWMPTEVRRAESRLKVAPAAGGKPRTVCNQASFTRSRRRIRWSADGRWLFYMEALPAGARLWKVGLRGGRPKLVAELGDIHTFDFDLSPDSKTLVYPHADYTGDLFAIENVEW
ncbi:MAG TPA: protein kinase [Myxococcota bacterium]|nr:protein kinase [Myxococcota bacterium]